MLKKEILDTLKSAKSRIVMLVWILVPMYHFLKMVYDQYHPYVGYMEYYPDGIPNILHPSAAAFLTSGGYSNAPQILLLWLLPIWYLLLYGDSCIREYRCGYLPLMDTRISRAKYFLTKNAAAFLLTFFLNVGSLALNYVLCWIAFPGNDFRGMEYIVAYGDAGAWLTYSIQHPVGVYILYILIFAALSGMLSCACVSLAMALRSYPLVYAVSFMLWYPQISTDYSVLSAMQPFIEYRADLTTWGILVYLLLAVAAVLVGYVRRVKYETI